MNKIQIRNPEIVDNRITYAYDIWGEWQEAFQGDRKFSVEYSIDLKGLPASIALIPFIANLLPMSWVYDAEICASCCDADFYYSIENIKQGYRDMYPMISFGGKLNFAVIEKNQSDEQKGVAAFFSGGVDAFNTLVCHVEENPILITLWGADVKLDDVLGWSRVEEHLKRTAIAFATNYVTAKTGFRSFLVESVLSQKVINSGDGWWHGFQHGLGIISHAAPIMYMLGKKTVYIASSFTAADKGKVTCASDPTIDNYIKFCGCNVVHDGYEFTRQMKVHNITQFAKTTGKKIPLRVCWESTGGSNCCNCEKCWRTILAVYAEGFDPRDFGFEYTSFQDVCKRIYKNRELLKWHRESRYAPMQEILKQNYTLETVHPSLRWFYKTKIDNLGEVSVCKKALKKARRLASRIKHGITG